jgi:uncharacterized membrane protein YgcG
MSKIQSWMIGTTALVCGVLLPSQARGEAERILSFDSQIEVRSNADLMVTETIVVRAEGQQIKHGIYRDFPQLYRGQWGLKRRTAFEVLSLTRDGRPEPSHQEKKDNGQRVYFGAAHVDLSPGNYTYQLTYRTDRQVGFFKDFDELYWNVTGNGWEFPIERASAIVRLPPDCPVRSAEAYTGPQGAKGRDYSVTQTTPGRATFVATRALAPKEGMTIVIGFPKGQVTSPSRNDEWISLVKDNIGLALAIAGLFLVLVYYLVVWFLVGRDPAQGVIIPRYEPPKGFSPASVRYLMQMGYDDKAFAANVIGLAVKGALTIEKKGDRYVLIRKRLPNPALTPDETAMATALIGTRERITLEQANHTAIKAALTSLKTSLALQLEKRYFIRNIWYWAPGLMFSLLPCAVSLLSSREIAGALFLLVWVTGWTVGTTALVSGVFTLLRAGHWVQAIPAALFALPFLAGECFGLVMFAYLATIWVPIVFGIGALMNGVFYHLLKAPTVAGRKTMDEIEGFRLYLSVAERDRLNLENPPEKTPQLFEMFLPYALALEVEQEWAEQFKDVLAAAAQAGTHYSPAWYAGVGALSTGALAGALGASLSSAISSSSTAPGSSSGGGGGGSSGGGGGGGGGGGW